MNQMQSEQQLDTIQEELERAQVNRAIRIMSLLLAIVLIALLATFTIWSGQQRSRDVPVAPGQERTVETPALRA